MQTLPIFLFWLDPCNPDCAYDVKQVEINDNKNNYQFRRRMLFVKKCLILR